jgi:hypothetical protein
VDGLGDRASYVTYPPYTKAITKTAYLVVLSKGTLMKLDTFDHGQIPQAQLEALARAILPRFT